MNVSTATALCRNLMTEHGFGYLMFGYAGTLGENHLTAGITQFMDTSAGWIPHKITLSLPWVKHVPDFKINELILHEIAHAKCPFGTQHGQRWQTEATKLGIRPKATFGYPTLPPELERYR